MGTEWAVAPPNRLRNQARILQWIALAPMGSRHGNCASAHKSQANASLQILSRKGLPSHFITRLVLTWGYSIKSRLATSLHVLLKSLRISFISSLLHGGVQIIGLWGIGRRCYSSIRRSGSDTTRCGLCGFSMANGMGHEPNVLRSYAPENLCAALWRIMKLPLLRWVRRWTMVYATGQLFVAARVVCVPSI